MTDYLLDTRTISDFFLGTGKTIQRLAEHSPSSIGITTVTVMEVLYGFQLNAKVARKLSEPFSDLCSVVQLVPFDAQAAEMAARIRAALKKKGQPVGSFDLLIAACALSENRVLVTSNTKEFSNIEGLRIENWR